MREVERFIGLMVDTFAHLYEEQGSGIRLGLEHRAKQLLEATTYAEFCQELQEWTGQCFDMLQSQVRKARSSYSSRWTSISSFINIPIYPSTTLL